MASTFFRERVDQHLRLGARTIESLRDAGIGKLHSRKLKSFAETVFP
jgi:AMP nucleosidase